LPQNSRGSVFPFLIATVAIGLAEDSVFWFFPVSPNDSAGGTLMLIAVLSWICVFSYAMYRLWSRSLWLLLGLPLIVFPYVVDVIGAGEI
jgi:hypothetical protein